MIAFDKYPYAFDKYLFLQISNTSYKGFWIKQKSLRLFTFVQQFC